MNKADLVNSLSKQTGLSKLKATEVINSIVSVVSESLSNGEKVTIAGFGTFAISKKEARKGRNPKTGEVIDISAKTVARFKSSSTLTKSLN